MSKRPHIHPIRTIAGGALVALLCIFAVSAASGQAAGKTKTLRIFSKPVSFTYTTADGRVSHRPPTGPSKPGDVLEIDSLDYAGNHKHHAKRPLGSDYLRCAFTAAPEPDCASVAAIGGSLLRFHGDKLVGGTLRYAGATGTVKNREVKGGTDAVLKLRLR